MPNSNQATAEATVFDRAALQLTGASPATAFPGGTLPRSRLPWYAINDKSPQDQFYTKREVARDCLRVFRQVAARHGYDLRRHTFVEPSAGEGGFVGQLPAARRIALDTDPQAAGIHRADFLRWTPPPGKYAVIGNPPFGLRGHLALQFINHSSAFADLVGFILPPLFNSDGKGVPGKRVRGYQLAHTENLPDDSFQYPDGRDVSVSSIFQVWTQVNTDKIRRAAVRTCRRFIRVYSLSDGGTPASTRNKKMLYACDVYLPSTCYAGMRVYPSFESLPQRRGYGVKILRERRAIKKLFRDVDMEKVAFRSTNGALNLRKSLIESVVIGNGYHD